MYNKAAILECAESLVGFREDNNDLWDALYNKAQATTDNSLTFNASAKTITWGGTGKSFIEQGFEAGQSITTTESTSNNATRTIQTVTATVITIISSQTLVDETSTACLIKSTGSLQQSTSEEFVNDLPGVTFENIDACLSPDQPTVKEYLQGVFESELYALINRFVLSSKQNYNSKELLSNHSITSGVASMRNKVTQNARFVGYWFKPHRSNYMRSAITHLGFQATDLQDNLKIYLYETSQLEPIKVFDLAITKKYSLEWTEVSDAILAWESSTGGTGQNYLIGYYENDPANPQDYQLQSQAIYMDFDCNCSGSPKEKYGRYLGIFPIEIPNDQLNWDADEEEYFIPMVDDVADYVTTQTYGLTAKINVTCDITAVLCQNIQMFAQSLKHAIASRILYDAYASNRINSIADSKRDTIRQFAVKYDGILNGYVTPAPDSVKIKGLIDTLTVDFSALDSYCLPCKPGLTKGYLVR